MRTNVAHQPAGTAAPRICQHPECAEPGVYRAPKSRDRLQEYYWFCLAHVRAYNSAWDYCAGFGEAEIEAQIRAATCWERPTWRLGAWHSYRIEDTLAAFADAFGVHPGRQRREQGRSRPCSAEDRALAVLGLTAAATRAEIKARYKCLVKRYHPDANGGDKQAEERLKVINQAYAMLRKRPMAV